MCPTHDDIEDTGHFLFFCPCFDIQRRDLIAGIYALLQPHGYVDLANEFLLRLLLSGDKDFSDSMNRHILQRTLNFIHKAGRFDCTPPFHNKPPNRSAVFVTIVFNFNFFLCVRYCSSTGK